MADLKAQTKCCVIEVWLCRLGSWCTHIMRHPGLSLARLWHVQQDSWLQERRARFFERPACRASAGFTIRWAEGWWAAVSEADGLGWHVRKGDRQEELRRVQVLKDMIFGSEEPKESSLAIEDSVLSIIDDKFGLGRSFCNLFLAFL